MMGHGRGDLRADFDARATLALSRELSRAQHDNKHLTTIAVEELCGGQPNAVANEFLSMWISSHQECAQQIVPDAAAVVGRYPCNLRTGTLLFMASILVDGNVPRYDEVLWGSAAS